MTVVDKTIGQLDPGGTIQTTDEIPVERGPDNFRVVVGAAGTKAASDVTKSVLAAVAQWHVSDRQPRGICGH